MVKYTLLELVQSILNDMDGDQVNSIFDTVESEQVATIVKDTYYALLSNRNWPHTARLITLIPSADPGLPTHVRLPDNVKELISLNYNKHRFGETRRMYQPVKYICPDDFLRRSNGRNNLNFNADIVIDPSGVDLIIPNNTAPSYFTSFNDTDLVFDSYDAAVDDTIQASKIQARAYVMPAWEHLDTHIPDLPAEAFMALLEEAKSRAMFKLKQMQDIKAEQESARQQSWLSRKAYKVAGGIKYPSYGRRGAGCYRDPTFGQGGSNGCP